MTEHASTEAGHAKLLLCHNQPRQSLMELEIRPRPPAGRRRSRSTRRRVQRKGRRFRAFSVGWIEAPGLFLAEGLGEQRVPIWIGLATSEASLRPFQSNLRAGATAIELENAHRTLTLASEIEYRTSTEVRDGIVSVTLWHAALELEPAPGEQETQQIRFVMRLRESWISAQAAAREVVIAEALSQYLGRRIRQPIPAAPEFRRQLYQRLLSKRYLFEDQFTLVGSPPSSVLVACNVNRSLLADLLQELTTETA